MTATAARSSGTEARAVTRHTPVDDPACFDHGRPGKRGREGAAHALYHKPPGPGHGPDVRPPYDPLAVETVTI